MTKKEKIISKIKENKSGIIICAVLFFVVLLLNLFRIFVNDNVSNNKEDFVKTENYVLTHSINKVIFTDSLGNDDTYYFNDVISMSASYLDIIENEPLIYFNNDETTYLYISNNSTIDFILTNGTQTKICARYSYDSSNYQLNLLTEISDGYLYCIVADAVDYNNYNNVNTSSLNILTNSLDYVSSFMGTIYIGYQGNNNFDYAYELGYQKGQEDLQNNLLENGFYNQTQFDDNYELGKNAGISQVVDNSNAYGLYSSQQYQDNYNKGYRDAEREITPDLASNGFMTMVNSILNGPFNIINGMLNFEIFGVNLFNLFSFFFTLCLIGFVIKLII